jgi:hypothetical protein
MWGDATCLVCMYAEDRAPLGAWSIGIALVADAGTGSPTGSTRSVDGRCSPEHRRALEYSLQARGAGGVLVRMHALRAPLLGMMIAVGILVVENVGANAYRNYRESEFAAGQVREANSAGSLEKLRVTEERIARLRQRIVENQREREIDERIRHGLVHERSDVDRRVPSRDPGDDIKCVIPRRNLPDRVTHSSETPDGCGQSCGADARIAALRAEIARKRKQLEELTRRIRLQQERDVHRRVIDPAADVSVR